MKKETIRGFNGYDIPCVNNLSGGERMAVIISHGFGSSKESPTAQAIAIVFMAVKLSLPVMLGFVLWKIRNRSRKFVAYSLWLVLIVYSAVMLLHAYWIIRHEWRFIFLN